MTAEDVGKFPDKNLAEALQRVPGVVTQKDFGEGERINLRGTLDTLTNVTLNGHSLSTADWFILDQQNATRSFNYLMLPADLIGRVEVQKTAQADVQEGGIGGTVNVETRKPLALQPFTAYASVEGVTQRARGQDRAECHRSRQLQGFGGSLRLSAGGDLSEPGHPSRRLRGSRLRADQRHQPHAHSDADQLRPV